MAQLPKSGSVVLAGAAVVIVAAVMIALALENRPFPSDASAAPTSSQTVRNNDSPAGAAGKSEANVADIPKTEGVPLATSVAPTFKSEMQPYYEVINEANLARICSLRSEGWFETILKGYMLAQIKLEGRYSVSVDAANAASQRADAEFERHVSLPDACGRLLNSPTISKLDSYESGLSGGYH
jgi:hypothetical protein